MRTALTIFGSVLILFSALPYVLAVARRETKPRIVSWFTWTLLLLISCAATIADHDWAAALLLTGDAIGTSAIVIFGLKYGDRTFERLDIICLASALVGLTLWFIFNSPLIAVVASVTIDFVGAVPSVKHCWQKPYEETALTFAMGSIGSLATLAAIRPFRLTAVVYPIYLVIVNGAFASIVFLRRSRAVAGEPAELREL